MSKDTPNILLLTTDQQRFDTINAAGFNFLKTPNIDRLAKEGCTFRNAYSPNPVCIPARHNLLTGLPARYHNFDDNYFAETRNIPYNLPTFSQILSDAEYDTIAIGKMHFQPYRRHNGFHKLHLMDEIPRYREDDEYAMYLKEQGLGHIQSIHGVRHLLYMLPQRSIVPEEHHGSKWVADKTIEYLDANRGRRPFLIWTGWIAPHPPFDVPDRLADLYKDADIPEPHISKTPLSTLAVENAHIADYPNEKYLRRARELYYAAITHVDENIGRILDKLEEIGELDNTLIIFTSDHGEILGDYGTYQKFLPYDSSAKIPMIMRYPKLVKPGSFRDDFVDLNDILPTMLDVANVDYPSEIELPGASVFKDSKDRNYQYIEHNKGNKRWISLRDKSYKYNYYYGGGYEELFDMVNDPHETFNLLYENPTEEALKSKDRLRRKLVEYEEKYGLGGCVNDGDIIKLEPYKKIEYRETNFPIMAKELVRQEEIDELTPMYVEVLKATEKEPIVNLKELDLKTWQEFGGYSDEIVQEMIRRDEERKKKQHNP